MQGAFENTLARRFRRSKVWSAESVVEGGSSETKPNPLLSKEGWLRLNKKTPFLSGADGVVSKFKQIIGKLRDLLLTTPSARLRMLRSIY